MKKLLILKGAKRLNKVEQQSIKGGVFASGMFCCEWCRDGTCNGWVDSIHTPCPIANTCD
ncbi:hypothetical protein [Aquimarina litoralis]|uniref:hypothetical protein n=1 Tax=Aquimarina litoralis TaxID=584605 RepID=UPI001C5916C7|nr:hypothetical protein [Aquimarina litoralis]MBW1294665.1 hypothetical protein [Aquimarina litoralis]